MGVMLRNDFGVVILSELVFFFLFLKVIKLVLQISFGFVSFNHYPKN